MDHQTVGNGKYTLSWASSLINIATSGVLLGAFVIWWQVANPTPRLDKIELVQSDLRKELTGGYLSLREHQEFQVRNDRTISALEKRLDDVRSLALSLEEKTARLNDTYLSRNEAVLRSQRDDRLFDVTQDRINRLYGLFDDVSRRISSIRELSATKDQSRLPPGQR